MSDPKFRKNFRLCFINFGGEGWWIETQKIMEFMRATTTPVSDEALPNVLREAVCTNFLKYFACEKMQRARGTNARTFGRFFRCANLLEDEGVGVGT
jgi:hypothetical protein